MWQKTRLMFVLLVGCSGGAKYPEGSSKVHCTNLVDDCDQQIAEQCPAGHTVLESQNWSTQLSTPVAGREPGRPRCDTGRCASCALSRPKPGTRL